MIRISGDPDHEKDMFFSRTDSHAAAGGDIRSIFELVSRSDNDYDHSVA